MNIGPAPRSCICTAVASVLAMTSGMNERDLNSQSRSSIARMTPAIGVLNVADIPAAAPALPDSRTYTFRKALQRQHELMLMRLQPGIPGGLLAEIQESADLIAQFRERTMVRGCEWLFHAGQGNLVQYIVSRHIERDRTKKPRSLSSTRNVIRSE